MQKKWGFAILCFSLVAMKCTKEIKPQDIKFQVEFDEETGKIFYPSAILATASFTNEYEKLVEKHAREKEESIDGIKYKITSPEDGAILKIKLKTSAISRETIFQTTMGAKGTRKTFFPRINWNYEKLKCLYQPGNTTFSFVVYINNKEIDHKNIVIRYRSVNEYVFGLIDKDKKYVDLSFLFAGYVNEDHPKIDVFLKEVLEIIKGKIPQDHFNGFIGYQGRTANSVHWQVFAIWYALQKKGVKYSSITDTSNRHGNVYSQNVRFFDQVYNNAQANCVDGSVFLASVLEKIGIHTFLVLVPGHMYLGYYANKNDKRNSMELLETTMIGNYNEETAQLLNAYGYKDYYHSLDVFNAAIKRNLKSWNRNIAKFNNQKNHEYQIFPLHEFRRIINPIPSCK